MERPSEAPGIVWVHVEVVSAMEREEESQSRAALSSEERCGSRWMAGEGFVICER